MLGHKAVVVHRRVVHARVGGGVESGVDVVIVGHNRLVPIELVVAGRDPVVALRKEAEVGHLKRNLGFIFGNL